MEKNIGYKKPLYNILMVAKKKTKYFLFVFMVRGLMEENLEEIPKMPYFTPKTA